MKFNCQRAKIIHRQDKNLNIKHATFRHNTSSSSTENRTSSKKKSIIKTYENSTTFMLHYGR